MSAQPSEEPQVVCFQCGQTVGDPPRANVRPDGSPCPACAERLLASLPPIFHALPPAMVSEPEPEPEDQDA